jgi:glutamate-1-semialdehyde 2,1-aminomutase
MSRGATRSTIYVPPHPPYAVSGRGAYVTDQFGRELLDLNNNYTAVLHGHAFPPIVAAVTEQITRGTAFGLPTESEVVLAELLAARIGLPVWRFSNSGSEAVMAALRAARAFTGRDLVIRFAGSYHGGHETVVDAAAPGIPASIGMMSKAVPQGDREAFDAVMSSDGARVAAVLIDLMPNRTGLVPADADFVTHVRDSTTACGALLVVDEVITLRVAMGGMHASYGITPDLVTVGKIMGGGFPVGAVGGRTDVMAVFDPLDPNPVTFGGTFSANPVTMVAGRVALEHFAVADVDRLNELGGRFRSGLQELGIAVSGFGSLTRLQVDQDATRLWWSMYQQGVLAGAGTLMALSTPMTSDDVDTAVRRVAAAVRQSG